MTDIEQITIDVETTEAGCDLVITADRSQPRKNIKGQHVERIRLDRIKARVLIMQIQAALG